MNPETECALCFLPLRPGEPTVTLHPWTTDLAHKACVLEAIQRVVGPLVVVLPPPRQGEPS